MNLKKIKEVVTGCFDQLGIVDETTSEQREKLRVILEEDLDITIKPKQMDDMVSFDETVVVVDEVLAG